VGHAKAKANNRRGELGETGGILTLKVVEAGKGGFKKLASLPPRRNEKGWGQGETGGGKGAGAKESGTKRTAGPGDLEGKKKKRGRVIEW